MYVIMEPKGNEEEKKYWVDQCMEIKYKLTHP